MKFGEPNYNLYIVFYLNTEFGNYGGRQRGIFSRIENKVTRYNTSVVRCVTHSASPKFQKERAGDRCGGLR